MSALAVVSSDGTVLWIPPAKFRVPAFKAPSSWASALWGGTEYDWTCIFKFGSWTYDGFKLDMDFYDDLHEIDLSDYVQGLEVVDHSAKKHVKYYPCCVEPYPDLVFNLTLKK